MKPLPYAIGASLLLVLAILAIPFFGPRTATPGPAPTTKAPPVVTTSPTRTPSPTLSPTPAPKASTVLPPATTFHALLPALPDPELQPLSSASAVSLEGLVDDLQFVGAGELLEREDGVARLTALLASQSNPGHSFRAYFALRKWSPPPASPAMLELDGPAYSSAGGPVDPANWGGYRLMRAFLIGMDDLDGVILRGRMPQGALFQLGPGANGRNAELGASAPFAWAVLSTGGQDLGLANQSKWHPGSVHFQLASSVSFAAVRAYNDPVYKSSPASHAVTLPGIDTEFVFISGGRFTESSDGSARLTGVIARETDSESAFYLDVRFANRTTLGAAGYPPPSSPKKELSKSAYLKGGGPIDTRLWHYYTDTQGELIGLGDYAGAHLQIGRAGPAFQVGPGANGKNTLPGASGWLDVNTLSQPDSGPGFPQSLMGDINVDLRLEARDCVRGATGERVNGEVNDWALRLPGVGEDFDLVGGRFLELPDGTARVLGQVQRRSAPDERFTLDVWLTDRVDPGASDYPPSGSPKLDLPPTDYTDQGGPIDAASWHYYETVAGELIGGGAFEGARLTIARQGPAFQVGLGASGKSLAFGAGSWIEALTIDQPTTGLQLPPNIQQGDMAFELGGDCVDCVRGSLAERAGGDTNDYAFLMPAIADDFVFSPNGRFVETADGQARLFGRIERRSDPAAAFEVDVRFSSRVDPGSPAYPPVGSPYKLLPSEDFVENGGPIDASTWHYYTSFDGTLTGLGSYAGAIISLSPRGPAFQVGTGASGRNHRQGASAWFDGVTLVQPSSGPALPSSFVGDTAFDSDGDCVDCPSTAFKSNGNGHAVWMPELAKDLRFVTGARFEEHADGTATLTGIVASASDPTLQLSVDMTFSDRVVPGAVDHPPVGSPKKELGSSHYVENGGPVDPSTWRYWRQASGTFHGLGQWAGAELSISGHGPAFQAGLGANGKNVEPGASGWFIQTVVKQPTTGVVLPSTSNGDFNLNFNEDCIWCVLPAPAEEPWVKYSGGHSFWLPGISKELVFVEGGTLVEEADGSLRMTGVLADANLPGLEFIADVVLSDPILPGDPAHPPAGSPKLELESGAYVENGGPVDPSTWIYYSTLTGTLTGQGLMDGAVISIARFGPPFQIGFGASGKNVRFGGAGWLDVTIDSQPTQGPPLPDPAPRGDINVDLDSNCP